MCVGKPSPLTLDRPVATGLLCSQSALLSRLRVDLDDMETGMSQGLDVHHSGKMAVLSSLLENLQPRHKVVLISYYTQVSRQCDVCTIAGRLC